MLLPILLLALGGVSDAPAQIAYVSDQVLYVQDCDLSGAPLPTRKPIRICAVPSFTSISWSRTGQIELEEDVYDRRSFYRVAPVWGARPHRVRATDPDAFPSPTGTATARIRRHGSEYDARQDDYVVTSGGHQLLIAENTDGDPVWSPKGDAVGLVVKTGDRGIAEVMRYPDVREERGLGEEPSMRFLSFSPDEKSAAIAFGAGHHRVALVDLATGRRTEIPLQTDLGASSADWSPDGTKVLLRMMSESLGWYGDQWLFDRESGEARKMDDHDWGHNFSPDSRHLFLTDKNGSLQLADLDDLSKRRLIAPRGAAFCVRRLR